MSAEQIWNDESRDNLRKSLQRAILGNLRLANREHAELLEHCSDVYRQDECPASEQDKHFQFARRELDRAAQHLASEQAEWPDETDCDRLDRVEVALRKRGIVLWQVSPCCDTCSFSELPDRIQKVDEQNPGFRDSVRGYAFFIDQNMPDMLAESTNLSLYFAYGWLSQDGSKVDPDDYAINALGIAREICSCLRDEGFEVDWNGTLDRKIGVSLNWQRRTLLE